MSNIAGVIQPTKFLLIMIQIILLAIIYETKVRFLVSVKSNPANRTSSSTTVLPTTSAQALTSTSTPIDSNPLFSKVIV